MSTIGSRLGLATRSGVGTGASIAPADLPRETEILYNEWKHGLVASDAPENIGPGAAASLSDVEVDRSDSMIRAPGVTLFSDENPHLVQFIFQQAAVDFSTELVVIDPPNVGHRSTGAFTWANLGIKPTAGHGWAVADVGGLLVFSNGVDGTYTRDAGANVVTDVSAAIIARCFATAFGRVFAGAFIDPITGLQALGITWNATSGVATDFTGLGSGAELLISNNPLADEVVAMIPIGLQTLGILCRRSLWVGYQTGIDIRPADFQQRFVGMGAVSRDTAVATDDGIAFLCDDGVVLFTLSQISTISVAIDSLLQPLDYNQIDRYCATYDTAKRRYILATPAGTFIYEFPHDNLVPRWFYRTIVPDSVTVYTDQSDNLTWNKAVGTWDTQRDTWATLIVNESNAPSQLIFGMGTKIGYEDYGATDNLGVAQVPFWQTSQSIGEVTRNIETHAFEIQYRSEASASLIFSLPDTNGDFTINEVVTLPSTSGSRDRVLVFVSNAVSRGAELQITLDATSILTLERVRRVVMDAGPSIVSTL